MNKPISEACLRNQGPIAAALKERLPSMARLLEIGSGTGQHAVFCAQALPHIKWQTSDLLGNHDGMLQWIEEAGLDNVLPPLELDVDKTWPDFNGESIDHVFTANTVHYIAWGSVVNMFAKVSALLAKKGLFVIYGPVNVEGQFTSEGNAGLDEWLKTCVNPLAGIKDMADIKQLAKDQGLALVDNLAMPANNRLLVLQKQ
ncbi:MAG: cyclopropane fatty-acyl-phospholipid synthase-like methyltransferase [Oleispira sp.]|jgi:cyclopropane fatty-acyl-phospholipid synthase-like methyltransferase